MPEEVVRIGGLELRFLLDKERIGDSLDLFEMTVEPKARVPVAHHHESWDETVYGLSGTTTWRIEGAVRELGPGETIFIKRGAIHSFHNESQEPATCLCVLSPGVLGPGYFREMAALLAAGAEPARLRETMLRHGLIPAPGA